MDVALVNTNQIQPSIGPIGLDYLAEALNRSGHRVDIFDPFEEGLPGSSLEEFFRGKDFRLIGVSLRNTDDCVFTSRQSFLAPFVHTVKSIRQHTDGAVVLGGVGFSVMPEKILKLCSADAGVWGEGEFLLAELANRIEEGRDWNDLPNLVWQRDGRWQRNPPRYASLEGLPIMTRRWVDNPRYFREGGQAGFETKRGCPQGCVYCADPVAKGNHVRIRPPGAVGEELDNLLAQGINYLHTCDSEFNIPADHALEICREIIRRNLDEKLRWYAYCSPVPFSRELANLMRKAGCAGINFGVDSGDGQILRRLERNFSPDDILDTVRWCREAGMAVMLDLLLGSPGESRESIFRTVELMRRAEPDRVGVAVGVRIYPGTKLAQELREIGGKEGLAGGEDEFSPLFFLEPQVAPFIFGFLDELIGEDRRFFFFDPSRPERNYNYNANQRLREAIQQGYRGAYWDILRRYE
jgi:radical SAM superfamily enzyme YgiQ (UPF0313 family)